MPHGDSAALRAVAERVVTAAGFDLEDLSVVLAGRRRLVKVIVDSDTGVDLDRAAELSRTLSQELDRAEQEGTDLGALPYVLEVTSPGVGRPLTLPRHFRRARGRLLAVGLSTGESLAGRVREVDGDVIEILTGPAGLTPRRLALADIRSARVEVEFAPPPAPVLAALGTAARVDAEPAGPDALDDPLDDDALDDDPLDDDPFDDDDEAGDALDDDGEDDADDDDEADDALDDDDGADTPGGPVRIASADPAPTHVDTEETAR